MRLLAIELEEFRGWVHPQRIDLSPSVVIVHGANGTGKTSLFDGVLWALAGELPRLHEEHKNEVVSLYGETGICRVRVELKDRDEQPLSVTRIFDGSKARLILEDSDGIYEGPEASREVIKRLWPSGTGDQGGSMAATLTRAVYLQQDAVRQFIETDTDAERFAAVAELVGAGRYTELQERIDRERTAWNTQSNQRRVDIDKLTQQVAQIDAQVSALAARTPAARGWAQWRAATQDLLPNAALPNDIAGLTSANLDDTVRSLSALATSSARRVSLAEQALDALTVVEETKSPTARQLQAARRVLASAEKDVQRRDRELVSAEKAAADERHSLRRSASAIAETATFAELALHKLGSECPVCGQTYDRASTEKRLRQLTRQPKSRPEPLFVQVEAASVALRRAEAVLADRRQRLRELQSRQQEKLRADRELRRIATALGMPPRARLSRAAFQRGLRQDLSHSKRIQRLADVGETFALRLAQASETRRRRELVKTLTSSRGLLDRQTSELELRDKAANDATQVLEGLRGASEDLVADRILALGPVLDRVFARIDPHPGFQAVELLTRVWHGKGRLTMRLKDAAAGVESAAPHVVLSSSQLNGLALAVFLTLNLGVANPPLTATILDDPLQSLDEINLLGVVDLFRRLKARRQVLISTHDQRLAGLLQRKLRPVTSGESLGVIRISEWRRDGPVVQQVTLPASDSPWRIAAQR